MIYTSQERTQTEYLNSAVIATETGVSSVLMGYLARMLILAVARNVHHLYQDRKMFDSNHGKLLSYVSRLMLECIHHLPTKRVCINCVTKNIY